jgi:hypothetical protein
MSDIQDKLNLIRMYNVGSDEEAVDLVNDCWRKYSAESADLKQYRTRVDLLTYLQSKARTRISFTQGPDRYEAEKVHAHITQQLADARALLDVSVSGSRPGFSAQVPERLC